MIRFVLFAFVLGLAASHAEARTSVVRSGEHRTFTRLTVQVPQNARWSIFNHQSVSEISVDQPEILFDTSQVFNRIPKKRLIDLEQSGPGGALLLTLGCECDVTGFKLDDTMLVIDIKDPEENPTTEATEPAPIQGGPFGFSQSNPHETAARREDFRLPAPVGFNRNMQPQLPPDPAVPDGLAERSTDVAINISEQRLLEQIARASQQGLITPVSPNRPAKADPVTATGQIGTAEQTFPAAPNVNIVAATSIDRDMKNAAGLFPATAAKQQCLSADMVSISEWSDGRTFSEQIGELRAEVFEEFDRLDKAALRNLAKTYLHFGFGAEATDALQMTGNPEPEDMVLLALAKIVDDDPIETVNPLDGQESCTNEAALWAVLSHPELASAADPDTIQQAFARLPLHLRAYLGPRLSQVFSRSGDPNLAAAILRATDRSGETAGPAQDFAHAVLQNSRGNVEDARRKMTDAVDQNTEFSPEALIELIETHWVERLPIAPDLPDLAAAYAVELRMSEMALAMHRAHAISLALSGAFDAAFAQVSEIAELYGGPAKEQASIPVLFLLAENADNVTFLKHAMNSASANETALPVELEDATASRLLELGFPETAMTYLSAKETGPASSGRRLMRTEAAIALGLPHRALIELLGVTGPEAERLRADAMWQNGDVKRASEILQDSLGDEAARRGFWLSDSLDQVDTGTDSKYATLTEISLRLQEEAAAPEASAPLASARALLSGSERTREEIDSLLGLARDSSAAN
ncbi:hypothetical protein QO034_01080 [Sedimentitalea sp. JM2-8]|uniref:Uncharacterized protein n=1 Tax=Sedimentitalea xiamensis TaxID=3050037 RepID=A0ABT7F9P8_9RHOB|nr:hypothetical protein [Sedimentitalea xiamensis]MDK3071690.1 hypothetical protein [Sedimentitalea xiamensis]